MMNTLTLDERERLVDCALKIQSVSASLNLIEPGKLPVLNEMLECLKATDESLRDALGYFRLTPKPS